MGSVQSALREEVGGEQRKSPRGEHFTLARVNPHSEEQGAAGQALPALRPRGPTVRPRSRSARAPCRALEPRLSRSVRGSSSRRNACHSRAGLAAARLRKGRRQRQDPATECTLQIIDTPRSCPHPARREQSGSEEERRAFSGTGSERPCTATHQGLHLPKCDEGIPSPPVPAEHKQGRQA